jgi:hypothetical protein
MAAARKPRKRKLNIQVEHAVYGSGILDERRVTDSGPVVVVTFADGTVRSLLAAPSFWISLPDLAAIPIAKAAALEPVPEDDDEGDEPVMDEEEPELVTQEHE